MLTEKTIDATHPEYALYAGLIDLVVKSELDLLDSLKIMANATGHVLGQACDPECFENASDDCADIIRGQAYRIAAQVKRAMQ